nr:unnamed protein product [Callosobruchus analis]
MEVEHKDLVTITRHEYLLASKRTKQLQPASALYLDLDLYENKYLTVSSTLNALDSGLFPSLYKLRQYKKTIIPINIVTTELSVHFRDLANVTYIVNVSHKHKVIMQKDTNAVLATLVCTVDSESCMKGVCLECKKRYIVYDKRNQAAVVDLRQRQYKAYRQCINGLSENEVALHIHFSENYACKYHSEVQSHHFGSSHKTGNFVLYSVIQSGPWSFCDLGSPSSSSHVVKKEHPAITIVHFFLTGPLASISRKLIFT